MAGKNNIVVIGISKERLYKGEQVYLDTDASSGGYPYWTNWPDSARKFSSPEDALHALDIDYMYSQASNIQIATIEYVFTPIRAVTPDLTKLNKSITDTQNLIRSASGDMQNAINKGDTKGQVAAAEKLKQHTERLSQLQVQLKAMQ